MSAQSTSVRDLPQVASRLTVEHSDLFANLDPYVVSISVDSPRNRLRPGRRTRITVVLDKSVPRDLSQGVPTDFDGASVRTILGRANQLV